MLILYNSFLAEPAFRFLNCSAQTSCIFLYPFIFVSSHFGLLLPFIRPSSKIYIMVRFTQIFCLIPYWVKRVLHTTPSYSLALILFACSLLHVAWSNNLQVPFDGRNLLFKCTVGGTYDLREKFKPSATTLMECQSLCSPRLSCLNFQFQNVHDILLKFPTNNRIMFV